LEIFITHFRRLSDIPNDTSSSTVIQHL
jgi:hypothetical protein